MPPLNLLSLSPDLLRHTALWLPPSDRLNFALSCRYLYQVVWGPHAIRELHERYPSERSLTLNLNTTVQSDPPFSQTSTLRYVPQRMRQQHVSLAVTRDGSHVAVLPYDNVLRLLSLRNRRIDWSQKLEHNVYANDVWDLTRGRRIATPPRDNARFNADEAGLDVEVTMDFSADDSLLLVSGPTRLLLYARSNKALKLIREIVLHQALERILGEVDYARAIGGGAALSPDAKQIAWVVFSGSPARVFVTLWGIQGQCMRVVETTTIHPRRWSALGWARVTFTPNGRYCLLVVNAAKKVMRVERIGNEFKRIKRCRYVLMVLEGGSIVREKCEWLELDPKVYAKELARVIGTILEGLDIHVGTGVKLGEEVRMSERALMRETGVTLNYLHSCPAEATYKGLSFGSETRHPWFIIKQPMYSLHLEVSGKRVHVATSPHTNRMLCLERGGDEVEVGKNWRGGPVRRKRVFGMLPWRNAFACVTAFCVSGEWVGGVCLLDDDRCVVSLRNMTMVEYFGE